MVWGGIDLGPKSIKKTCLPLSFLLPVELFSSPSTSECRREPPPPAVPSRGTARSVSLCPSLLSSSSSALPSPLFCKVNSGEFNNSLGQTNSGLNQNEWVGFGPIQKCFWAKTNPTLLRADGGPTPTFEPSAAQFLLGWFRPSQDGLDSYIWASPSHYNIIILYFFSCIKKFQFLFVSKMIKKNVIALWLSDCFLVRA